MDDPNAQVAPQEDPVSLARKIVEIEKNLKSDIADVQKILIMIVQGKLDLDKIKSLTKDNLKSLIDE